MREVLDDLDEEDDEEELDWEAARVGSAVATLHSALDHGRPELVVLVVRDLLHAHAREWLTWGRVGANASPFQDADRIPSVAYELGRLDGEHALASARVRVGEALGHVDEGLENESRLERARRVAASWWMSRESGLEGLTRAIAEELRRASGFVPAGGEADPAARCVNEPCEADDRVLGEFLLAEEGSWARQLAPAHLRALRHLLADHRANGESIAESRYYGQPDADAACEACVGDFGDSFPLEGPEPIRVDVVLCGRHRLATKQALEEPRERVLGRAPLVFAVGDRVRARNGRKAGQIGRIIEGIRAGIWTVQFGVFEQGDIVALASEDLDVVLERS